MSKAESDQKPQQPQPREKRRGFHPVLVISTIFVVVFVLWFCPYALMQARMIQTEERAAAILTTGHFTAADKDNAKGGFLQVIPEKKYSDYIFYKSTTQPAVIYAVPEYYGETAIFTLCLQNGSVFKKNIPGITPSDSLPPVDNTWQQ